MVAPLVSCSDFLDTSSPSVVDSEFVFSNSTTAAAALDGAYFKWRGYANSLVFGAGLFYATDIVGSDIERHPEKFSAQPGRHYPETFYQNGTYAGQYGLLTYQKENTGGLYGAMFDVIGKANAIITAMENASNFAEKVDNATEPNSIAQIYGEAIALRATAYRELIKYFGDVPYNGKFGEAAGGIVSRDSVYDILIAQLRKVEPLMYVSGKLPGVPATEKDHFSRTYVQGLIGRMCLDAAGYQTRPNSMKYVNGKGEPLTFEKKGRENNGAFYGRRSDWQDLYRIAKEAYAQLLQNPGNVKFYTTDPRGADAQGREYNNPYQYFFQQMMNDDAAYADESIYEYPMQFGTESNERPYSSGRVSSGAKTAYPAKSYGQARIVPAYYYGKFDPKDKRRDVSACVTGSDGASHEVLIPFTPASTSKGGGITMNKFDENRQTTPNWKEQRKSGINGPYMRMSEIYLSYAEVCAVLGENGEAKRYLSLIRNRAFNSEAEADVDGFIAKCGSLLDAIIEERGFEFAGEGDRRWTLIRNGVIADRIRDMKNLMTAMVNGLKTNGYYRFENGNVISNYVWTKLVDAKGTNGYRLTTQCPAGKESDPVLYPGWRGQHDNWESMGCAAPAEGKTNLAIKGLFDQLTDAEIAALEADGYKKVDWGKGIVDNEDEYVKYYFYDYDYESAPIYLWPFTPNTLLSGGFANMYGFKQD